MREYRGEKFCELLKWIMDCNRRLYRYKFAWSAAAAAAGGGGGGEEETDQLNISKHPSWNIAGPYEPWLGSFIFNTFQQL